MRQWPESRELRQGVQEGALTRRLVNRTPSSAMQSKLGVWMTSLGVPGWTLE
ncbi:MAG: hypothetical protein R2748_03825 [Bryobacterales bacterium]